MSKVYEIVQDKIVKAIEDAIENGGTAPWRKPWKGGVPRNFISKKPYRGVNLLMLDGGSYLTFKQITDLQKKNPEVKLKKGSKSEIVVFWKFPDKEEEKENDDEEKYGPIFKYYRVFHISNVEGLVDDVFNFDHVPNEQGEKLIEAYKKEVRIDVLEGSDRAYYTPALDRISVPALSHYEQPEEFYSTTFHEMVHSTGHKKRLDRFDENESTAFGSESYSKEELVAEIGANMILATLGIECKSQQENSISYLYGWLSAIKKDPKLIVSAAQKAQKASDYILKFVEEKENDVAV
ncbi:zincin-like metallopeptidase domain-containing protein [Priestia megaterium]|uniref:ArdC family protein n=1 Tax=Priestia megaterium TaxID=1404 RepID=UPI003D2BA044